MKALINFSFVTLLAICPFALKAQEAKLQGGSLDTEAMKQANNPMASIKTINVHNYYISSLHGMPDGVTANQAMLRYAQPLGKFIIRATMPIVTSSIPSMPNGEGGFTASSVQSGLGDFNMFVIYDLYQKNGRQIGIGPLITAPTGTNNMGAKKWQAGLSALYFDASKAQIQLGGLIQWQASFAGSGNASDVSILTAQPFILWQLGKGTYLRNTAMWTFDFDQRSGNIPIGLGIGQVIKVGKTVFNVFAEPQISAYTYGVGQSKFQLFMGFNTQF